MFSTVDTTLAFAEDVAVAWPDTGFRTLAEEFADDVAPEEPPTIGAPSIVADALAEDEPALEPKALVDNCLTHVTVTDSMPGVPLTAEMSRNRVFPPSRTELDIVVVDVPSSSAAWAEAKISVPADSGVVLSSTLNVAEVAAVT
jgi:hypothetical protein